MTCLNMIQAQESLSLQDFPNYLVTEKSQIYPMIENAYIDIFKSKLGKTLCSTAGNALNLHYSMGLSPETAMKIANTCDASGSTINKNFRRQYTVVYDKEHKIHFDSWTNKSGMTYLVFDKNVSYEKIKLMIVHELAISLDSKFKILSIGYLRHNSQGKPISMNLDVSVMNAFIYSLRNDFSHAFAISRANNFEKLFLNQKMTSAIDHQECIIDFKKNLNFIQNTQTSDFVKKTTHDVLASLIDQMDDADSNKFDDSNYDEHFNMITNSNLKLKDNNLGLISFCQYMSVPMFSTNSYYNMLANGPRPRTGGGWGDDGGGDSSGDASALVEKDLLKLNTQ